MAVSRARQFAKIAKDIDNSGNLTAEAISSDVTLGGATIYASRSNLPTAGNTAGDQAFTTDTNRLYIWNGSGWYNVALLNVAPAISSITDSAGNTTPFDLDINGTVTTITITAADSDGDPITYAASADSDFSGLATLSQADNVFTITPFSADSATTTEGTITFTATDGINVASSGIQTFTLTVQSEYWDETVLSVGTSSTNSLNNSTFIDRSTNAHTVTPTGTPIQTEFHPYLDNWSVFTDGANDTTTQQVHTLDSYINMGTGDFTIELWCRSYVNADRDGLFNFNSSSASYRFMFRNATTAATWELYYTSGSAVTVTYANSANPLNEWVHHAFVRSSGTLVWYINGVAKQTIANHAEDFDDVDVVDVGKYGSGRWPGWISNFRVIKGDAIYTSNFTVPTGPLSVTANTILLLNSGNSFKNRGSLTTTIETSGTILPQISAFTPFGQVSEYAVGENKGSVFLTSNNQLEPISGSIINVGTGDFTVEFWCYGIPNDDIVIDMRAGTSNTTGAMLMSKSTGFRYQSTSTATTVNGPDPAQKQWLHVAVVRSSGNVTYYANGVGEALLTGDTTNFGSTSIAVGSSNSNGYDVIEGYVSDLRITKSAIYTSNFTPPTEPVGNTNASLYLPMDNAGIFDKTGNHAILLSGNTATSTTYTKYATTSVFTDTGGMLINKVSSPGPGDFCYEGWFYPTAAPGSGNAFISHGWGGYGAFVFYSSNTSYSLYMSSTGSSWNIVSGENINVTPWTGSWKHFAFTRSGDTIRVFLDGTQTYTKTISGSLASLTAGTDDIVGVGSAINGTSGVHGAMYVENFQIHRGIAKYTTSFTPPTKTQGITYQATS